MSQSAEAIVREFFSAYERGDLQKTMDFFSPEAVYTDGPRGVYRGVEAIRAALEPMMTVAPTVSRNVKSVASGDTTVMIERVDRFQRDSRSVEYEIAAAVELDADGRIKRWRDYYDLQSIVDQIVP